ncbi:MAG: hypothetical protein LRY68_09090 [Sulfurospirillum sp.]|nr:hypothetical protein [Sulfurospirillum sp.]
MKDNIHPSNDFKLDFAEFIRGVDGLCMLSFRDFATIAKDFTADPKQIKECIKIAEQERLKKTLEMGDEWADLTDEKLTKEEKEDLLINTFRAVENGLGDTATSYLGGLEHRCSTKPIIRNKILSLLKELNFHIVGHCNYYPYFEIILLQILQNIDDFTGYEQTAKTLINLPQSHKMGITLNPKLEHIAIISNG